MYFWKYNWGLVTGPICNASKRDNIHSLSYVNDGYMWHKSCQDTLQYTAAIRFQKGEKNIKAARGGVSHPKKTSLLGKFMAFLF